MGTPPHGHALRNASESTNADGNVSTSHPRVGVTTTTRPTNTDSSNIASNQPGTENSVIQNSPGASNATPKASPIHARSRVGRPSTASTSNAMPAMASTHQPNGGSASVTRTPAAT